MVVLAHQQEIVRPHRPVAFRSRDQARLEVEEGLIGADRERRRVAVVADGVRLDVLLPVQFGAEDDAPPAGRIRDPQRPFERRACLVESLFGHEDAVAG